MRVKHVVIISMEGAKANKVNISMISRVSTPLPFTLIAAADAFIGSKKIRTSESTTRVNFFLPTLLFCFFVIG